MEDLSLGDRKAVHLTLEPRQDEALFIGWVDIVETAPKEKELKEKRILVVSKKRIYSIRPTGPKARDAHFLDLREMKSTSGNDLTLTFAAFNWVINAPGKVDDMVTAIRTAYCTAFSGMLEKTLYGKLEIKPESRLAELSIPAQSLGGFLSTYKSCCDYWGTEPNQSIVWELENVAAKLNTKEFTLKEFDTLDTTNFRPLMSALGYNKHFRILQGTGYKMNKDMSFFLADALKLNTSLEELHLAKTDLSSAGVEKISESLSFNKALALTFLDLANNKIEDKGLTALAGYISGMTRGIVSLSLANCGGGKTGMSALCASLKKNIHMTSTLTYFDISGNKLEADGSTQLAAFLAAPNSLQQLNVKDTMANLDNIVNAILRGSTNELRRLDVRGNKITKKEGSGFAKFVAAAATLDTICLADTTLPAESVSEILKGLNTNLYLKKVSVDMSENKLGLAGAKAFAELADKLTNITVLNLSDNEFGDDGVVALMEGMKKNNSIKHLSIDRAFKGGKSDKKTRKAAVDAVSALVGSTTSLESLSMQGGKDSELKDGIIDFLQAMAANTAISALDVSDNEMGDRGINALGKMLQTNEKLETLRFDGNGTTMKGFESFYAGLKRNRVLKNVSLPLHDIASAQKDGKEALDQLIRNIERLIARNMSPTASKFEIVEGAGISRNTTSGNLFAFFSSGLREEMNQYLNKIKSTGKKAQGGRSQVTVEDAENTDNTMTRLFNFQDEIQAQMEKELRVALTNSVTVIAPAFGKMKQQLIDKLMDVIQKSIKCLDDDTVRRLKTVLAFGGKDLNEQDLASLLVDSTQVELGAKASQGFFSVITLASEYLFEKIGDQLRSIYDDITSEQQQQEEQAVEEAKRESQSLPVESPKAAGSIIKTPTSPAKEEPKKDVGSVIKPAETGSVIKPKEEPKKEAPKEEKKKEEKKEDKKKEADGPVVHLESLQKKEGNLTHLNKARPQQAGKRPPTRKK